MYTQSYLEIAKFIYHVLSQSLASNANDGRIRAGMSDGSLLLSIKSEPGERPVFQRTRHIDHVHA